MGNDKSFLVAVVLVLGAVLFASLLQPSTTGAYTYPERVAATPSVQPSEYALGERYEEYYIPGASEGANWWCGCPHMTHGATSAYCIPIADTCEVKGVLGGLQTCEGQCYYNCFAPGFSSQPVSLDKPGFEHVQISSVYDESGPCYPDFDRRYW